MSKFVAFHTVILLIGMVSSVHAQQPTERVGHYADTFRYIFESFCRVEGNKDSTERRLTAFKHQFALSPSEAFALQTAAQAYATQRTLAVDAGRTDRENLVRLARDEADVFLLKLNPAKRDFIIRFAETPIRMRETHSVYKKNN